MISNTSKKLIKDQIEKINEVLRTMIPAQKELQKQAEIAKQELSKFNNMLSELKTDKQQLIEDLNLGE